jgi:hypothetical protein
VEYVDYHQRSVLLPHVITDAARSTGGRKADGVGVMKDKERKLEETERDGRV